MRKLLAGVATLALALGLAAAATAPANAAPGEVNTNEPANWVAVAGETCVKHDYSGSQPTSQTYGQLSSLFGLDGKIVTKVIVKAGSSTANPQAPGYVEFENQAYYTDPTYQVSMPHTMWTQVGALTATTFSHYSGKQISHIIVCFTTPPPPESVNVSAAPTHEVCETQSGQLQPGSILLTYAGDASGLKVSYRALGAVDWIVVGANPITGLAAGTYEFMVEALPGFTTTTAPFQVTIDSDDNELCGVTEPESVNVSAAPTHEVCETQSGQLQPGSILLTYVGDASGLKVSYRALGAVDWIVVGANPITGLAAGTYEFMVEALPGFTTTTAPFQVTIDPDDNELCGDLEVKVIGDPAILQECVVDDSELDAGSFWLAYLTITTADSEPSGSVQYRVFFQDGDTWVDQGVWPEGTYFAGPGQSIPYGTTVKVVAEAVAPYVISTPKEWEYTFTLPGLCELPDLPVVDPLVTFQQSCAAGATFTLAIGGGVPGDVVWQVGGGLPSTALGTFPASSPSTVTIVATPAPGNGFPGEEPVLVFEHAFGALDDCDLETLALTGVDDPVPALWTAAFLGLLGTALVRAGMRVRRQES